MTEPFKKGDRVRIQRHRHGWEDGRLEGVVEAVLPRATGTHSYKIRDDAGVLYDVRHSRDLRLAV